jgi:hypothetical protein
MTQNLSLMVLAGYAGLFLIAGFVWKKVRDYRDQRQQPRLPLTTHRKVQERTEERHLVASGG